MHFVPVVVNFQNSVDYQYITWGKLIKHISVVYSQLPFPCAHEANTQSQITEANVLRTRGLFKATDSSNDHTGYG